MKYYSFPQTLETALWNSCFQWESMRTDIQDYQIFPAFHVRITVSLSFYISFNTLQDFDYLTYTTSLIKKKKTQTKQLVLWDQANIPDCVNRKMNEEELENEDYTHGMFYKILQEPGACQS